MSCYLKVTTKDGAGNPLTFTVSFRFYTLKDSEWVEWSGSPFSVVSGGSQSFKLTETSSYKIVPLEYSSEYTTPPEKIFEGCEDGTYDLVYVPTPTISNISWKPKGNFSVVSAGASLTGETTELKVISTNPDVLIDPSPIEEGEALLEIINSETGESESVFVVAEYDHFRFDNKEWWALNIICGPECDMITLADEDAEALRTPKIGDEIQFACNIDWHGVDPDKVEWYYAKAPNRCFDQEEAAGLWELFAETQLPAHTFEAEDDHEIVFLKVVAKNADGAIGELGDTCRPIFNLWDYHPSWWDQILEAIRTANEGITSPITDLFPTTDIEGWTTPPFTCPICEQVFEGEGSELRYIGHIMSHITAFEQGWFE